jgi:hypothetical protein
MGPRTDLDVCEKSRPHRDSILGPPSPKPVAIPTELPGPRDILSRDINCSIPTIVELTIARKLKWIIRGVEWNVVDSIHLG